jgi:hypothetical protein
MAQEAQRAGKAGGVLQRWQVASQREAAAEKALEVAEMSGSGKEIFGHSS